MATAASLIAIQKIYIAYYQRPADQGGLEFWATELDKAGGNATAIINQFATSLESLTLYGEITSANIGDVLDRIYLALFDRTPDAGGKQFYTDKFNAGEFSAGDIALRVLNGAQEQDKAAIDNKLAVAERFTDDYARMGATYDFTTVEAVRDMLADVKADTNVASFNGVQDVLAKIEGRIFTLKEVYTGGTPAVAESTAVYWGFNPNGTEDDNSTEGPADGGVPLQTLIDFVTTTTGLDLRELGVVDDDGSGPFDNVTNLTLSNVAGDVAGDPMLTFTFADGTTKNAEVDLGAGYMQFLNDLLFDSEGNSRLYEKVTEAEAANPGKLVHIVLTPTETNGGTTEAAIRPTAGNDTFVAGRLDLLHGAYLDGGLGYNVLEIDAKGSYAQPKALERIQEIRIKDLPNFYSDGEGGYVGDSDYPNPDVADGEDGVSMDSWLDLSRGRFLEKLLISGQSDAHAGSLAVVGIRGEAATTVAGNFDGDLTLQYAMGGADGLAITLSDAEIKGAFNVAQNAGTLTLNSVGGGNHIMSGNLGGTVSKLVVTGDALLAIDGDLDATMHGNAVEVDASASTGGVDLTLTGSEDVVFKGSSATDVFEVRTANDEGGNENDQSVHIDGGAGNNSFTVATQTATVMAGDGANNVEIDADLATVALGHGANKVEMSAASSTVTVGDGANRVEIDLTASPNNALEGVLPVDTGVRTSITAGNGNNLFDIDDLSGSSRASITINTGSGNNSAYLDAAVVNFNSGDGNDVVEVRGRTITINTAGGNDSIVIAGTNGDHAANGAVINVNTGSGTATVTLGSDAWLAEGSTRVVAMEGSSISGENITLVVATESDLSRASLSGVTAVAIDDNLGESGAALTLTAAQFVALGASAFSVQGSTFGAEGLVKVIVSESTSLTAMGVDSLSSAINLEFHVMDGATLTMTAEQLHKWVAPEGVKQAQPDTNDVAPGKLVITGAGLKFNAFEESGANDAPNDNQGSIGSAAGDFGTSNVTITRSLSGYERPKDAALSDSIEVVDGNTIPTAETLLNGTTWKALVAAEGDARINLQVTDGETVGDVGLGVTNGGIKSTGVTQLMVTGVNAVGTGKLLAQSVDTAVTVVVCDSTEGLEAVGVTNLRNATVTFEQVNWGTEIVLEGDGYANSSQQPKNLGNPDESEVGAVEANFFEAGANAVVRLTNQGTTLGLNEDAEDGIDADGERVLVAKGITVTNADRLAIHVEDGDARIENLAAAAIKALTVSGPEDVELVLGNGSVPAGTTLKVINGNAVAGDFTLSLTANYWLADLAMTGVDAIDLDDNVMLTLSADQAMAMSASITSSGDDTSLSVIKMAGQALDLSAVDVAGIGFVAFSEGQDITVADGTDFGGASLEIPAAEADTSVTMTAEQFATTDGDVQGFEDGGFEASIEITALADEELDITGITDVSNIALHVTDLVATEAMEIITDGQSYALHVSGTVDLSEATGLGGVSSVELEAGAVLTLTAAQAAAIGTDDADDDGVADAWAGMEGAMLNIVGMSDEAIDMDAIAAAGITIGTVTIANADGDIQIDEGTTFGGAAAIITPTADAKGPEFGSESTTVTMTVKQYASSAGVITGDAEISLTGLVNNKDGADAGTAPDTAMIDTSGITAPKGTITLGAASVTLDAASDIGGFEIQLNGQMIRLATTAQADGATITETGGASMVAWLFTSLDELTEIDTSGYDGSINALYISEELVDGANEESLWTTLDGAIEVIKVNAADIPDVLVAFDRVNTFEAMTAIEGVTYDDTTEFGSIRNLTINLEGNTNIGDVVIGDSNGENAFDSLTINSYENRDTLSDDNGFTFMPNRVGDVTILNTADADVEVTLSANGLALEVGTLALAAEAGRSVTVVVSGEDDITIADIDTSDADITLVTVDASDHDGELSIGGIEPVDGVNDFDHLFIVSGHEAAAGEMSQAGDNLLVVAGGNNDLTAADTADLDAVHFTADATLTLTANQVVAIGVNDFTVAAGVTVTLNVTDLSIQALDLNVIAEAGINIGVVSTLADLPPIPLNGDTTLGMADEFRIVSDAADSFVVMTAAQYLTIKDGNVTEIDVDADNGDHVAGLGLTNVADLADDDGVVSLDLSTVMVTGDKAFALADEPGADDPTNTADVTFDTDSNLGEFRLVLDSVGGVNDLAGQTVRFTTAAQAERVITVANDGGAENSTNVVWLFDTIEGTSTAGKVDASGYEENIGRVWVSTALVSNQNVEDMINGLDSSIIVRVVSPDELTANLPFTSGFDREIEVEAFNSTLGNLTFADIDEGAAGPFKFIENLTVSLGGNVKMGDIKVSNILESVQNNDEFDTLTINSYLANDGSGAEYLLPEGYVWGDGAGQFPYPTKANEVRDIASGDPAFDLRNVEINTDNPDGEDSNDLIIRDIVFSDDGFDADGVSNDDPDTLVIEGTTASLTIYGDGDVTVRHIDTSDANIDTLNIETTGTGDLTVTGASPALMVGNTAEMTVTAAAGSVITFGTVGEGISGAALEVIAVTGLGDVNLGEVIAVDDESFTVDNVGGGDVTITMGAATLGAESVWTFNNVDVTITEDTVLTQGGTINLNGTSKLTVIGDVDLTVLDDPETPEIEGVNWGVTDYIVVEAGEVLTLTVDQLIALGEDIDVVGGGTLKLKGNADNKTFGSNALTAVVDLSEVTITNDDGLPGTGEDDVLEFNSPGAQLAGEDGEYGGEDDEFASQTVIGSVFADMILPDVRVIANEIALTLRGGVGNDSLMGGIADDVLTGGEGDDEYIGEDGDDTFNVDAGSDLIIDLVTGDKLVVSAGATATAVITDGFVATAATVNNGTANLEARGGATVDVSLATGSAGFVLSANSGAGGTAETVKGSARADTINGGDVAQTAGGADELTGNGGADTFVFSTIISEPTLTAVPAGTTGVDREVLTVTADAADDNNELIVVGYVLNGVGGSVNIDNDPALDVTNANAVASAIAQALNAVTGITATATTNVVTATADNSGSLDLATAVVLNGTTLAAASTDGTDVPAVANLTVGAVVAPGEVYTAKATLASGTVIEANYTVVPGDTSADVAAGIRDVFNAVADLLPGLTITATATGSVVTFTDDEDDNGGFTMLGTVTGALTGSGASFGTSLADADVITDFISGSDKIKIEGMAAGTATNYEEAASVADYATALAAADEAMDGTVKYFLTDSLAADEEGLLFFDANGDGTADGVLHLVGVTSANFAFGDIIAG